MMPSLRNPFRVLVLILSSLVSLAQVTPDEQAPTSDELRAQITQLQESEVPNRDELLGIYGQALQALERAGTLEERALAFVRQAEEAPDRLGALREALAQSPTTELPHVAANVVLRELEQKLREVEADRNAAQKLADDLNDEAQHRTTRLGGLPEEVANTRSAVAEREAALRTVMTGDSTEQARSQLLLAELVALRVEARLQEAERSAYEVCRELLPLRRDQAQRRLNQADRLVQLWQERVTNARRDEANQAKREAERQRLETAARFPALSEIATRNEELASLRSGTEGVTTLIAGARDDLLAAQQLRDETTRRFQATGKKVAVGGNSEGMGLLLRRELDWVRNPSDLRDEAEVRARELSRAQLLRITIQEEREAVGDIASRHEQLIETLGPDDQADGLSALALELLEAQRLLHDSLLDELGLLIGTLLEHGPVHRQLYDATVAYRAFIEERILWMPSTVGGPIPDLPDALGGLTWLVSPQAWASGMERSAATAVDNAGWCLLLGTVILGLLVFRRRFRTELVRTAEQVRSYRTDRIGHTGRGLLLTIGLALPLPLFCWTAGWFLSAPPDQIDVARATGHGLRGIFFTFITIEFLRQVAGIKHLGEAHFRWPGSAMVILRAELRWFLAVALPLEFLVTTFDREGSSTWNDSIGRLAFLGLAVAVLILWFRLFRPSAGLLAGYYRRGTTLLERTRRLWFGLLLAVPLTLIVLALVGYYYTAWRLDTQVRHSIGLGIGLLMVSALASRWLFLARRRLALEQARQRAGARAETAEAVGIDISRESGAAPIDEDSIDIPAIDAQTRKLFRSGIVAAALLGLFFIWADAFPALHALDRVQLWPEFQVAAVENTTGIESASVAVAASSSAEILPTTDPDGVAPSIVTLADLALALMILILTAIATKNAPGLLEIAILQRLPLDIGSRFALSTLFRYLILSVGLTAGFGAIGIGWGKIQWLVAALTFGLAFGLQEIFANFVSGIIILLERPIRVGDVVTVGATEGRVTRLRMRATTILDWDRREMLVPNKEFVTGSIVNWTLSDPITRVILPVGIAYGSDTGKARELLLQTARENELVLADPKPSAIFRNFGESSLDFELRIFMANRDLWPQVIDRLNTAIDDAFREAGIEIAFPQRDLHLRTAEGLAGTEAKREPQGRGSTSD